MTDIKSWSPIAICVPFANYEDTLPVTLKSINDNTYDKGKITLVFYDDCSADSSSQLIKNFIAEHGRSYHSILLERGIESSGGNVARVVNHCFKMASKTESRYVVNVEADVKIPSDALELLVSFLGENTGVGVVSLPYVYASGDQKTIEVDVTMGCTIISRTLLEKINWRIDERFDVTNDLWLIAKAEKLGFGVVSYRQRTAEHLKPFHYRTHVRNRLMRLPHYHWLLLKEGLMARRLKRSYLYYSACLLALIASLVNPILITGFGLLVLVGVFHYRSFRKLLYAFPVGIALTLGLLVSAMKTVGKRSLPNSASNAQTA